MNPIQKFLWLLVFLAACATAFAGFQALAQQSPPEMPPVNLGDAVPPELAGRVWIGHVVESDCPSCARLRESALAAAGSLESDKVTAVTIDRSGTGAKSEGWIRGDAADELAARFQAATGPPPDVDRPGDILLRNYGDLGTWTLTAEDGKPLGSAELAGQVWIADFMFTNCAGPCPMMNEAMKTLTGKLPDHPRLKFISFSVDPRNDTPEALSKFAKDLGAPPRWKFLTGMGVYNLAWERFKLTARPTPEEGPGNAVLHSTRFTLVDGQGRMRGLYTYDYDEPEKIPPMMERLVRDARALLETPEKVVDHVHDGRLFLIDRQGRLRGAYSAADSELIRHARKIVRSPDKLMSVRSLPGLNAALNGTSFFFLTMGLIFILNKRIGWHKAFMTFALVTSAVFLASYVTYHVQVGSVKYAGVGWMRTAYFGVLLSHTVLAVVVAPLALITVVRAWRGKFDRHVAIARWTLPVWMYVSLTGILVYLMLYRIP